MSESNNDEGGSKRKRGIREDVSFEALVDPNFEELARRFPDFGCAWQCMKQTQSKQGGRFGTHITQDFSIALTKALLHIHWGLALTDLPLHHLCPPVPNRYFFVQWIQQTLLPTLQSAKYFSPVRMMSLRGLDIGTGAACIYPLLFCASTKQAYKFVATDVDPESVTLAVKNVQSNQLESSICVLHVNPSDAQLHSQPTPLLNSLNNNSTLIPVGPLRRSMQSAPSPHNASLDFCMTNPPFYQNDDSVTTEPRAGDGRSRTAMTVSESSYPGGEVGFVVDMMIDTLVLLTDEGKRPPGWSCCMCGKKVSWNQLKSLLSAILGPGNVQTTEFGPGFHTRWFLAWTLERPTIRSPLARVKGFEFRVAQDHTTLDNFVSQITERIQEYFGTLSGWDLTVSVSSNNRTGQQWLQIRQSAVSSPPGDHDNFSDSVHRSLDILSTDRKRHLLSLLSAERRRQLLPVEGHWLMDVALAPQGSAVQVQVEAYQHSSLRNTPIELTRNQMQGEVCRSNRRWRRKLGAQQAQERQSMEE